MKTWKLVAGIASMVVAALVLTSVITSYRDYGGTAVQPRGLFTLAVAAGVLGLAGIVQIVFRDGQTPKVNLAVAGLYAGAFIFFVLTAILGTFDASGWIQLVAFLLWSAGCAVFTYLEDAWETKNAEKIAMTADVASDRSQVPSAADAPSHDTAGLDTKSIRTGKEAREDVSDIADLPPLPEAGQSGEFASNPPPRPDEVAEGAVWTNPTTAPPCI